MNSNTASATTPAPVNAGAENAAQTPAPGARVSMADLDNALMGAMSQAAPDDNDTAPELPAPGSPADDQTLPPEVAPGNEPEGSPDGGGDGGTEPSGEPEGEPSGGATDVLSSTGNQELDAALSGLTPAMRTHVVSLAGKLKDGSLRNGEVPRIGQLLADRHAMAETITQLTRERDEAVASASADAPARQAGAGPTLPDEIVKLKTYGEVVARQQLARENLREVQRALRRVGPDGTYTANAGTEAAKTYTLEQLEAAETRWQGEVDALPTRAVQIQEDAKVARTQAEARQQLGEAYPWVNDPESAQMKAVQARLKQAPWLRNFASPEYAAHVWNLGEKAAAAERAGRQAGGNGNGANGNGNGRVQRPIGKVQPGKPHTPSSNAVQPSDAMRKFQASLPKPGARITSKTLEETLAGAMALNGKR